MIRAVYIEWGIIWHSAIPLNIPYPRPWMHGCFIPIVGWLLSSPHTTLNNYTTLANFVQFNVLIVVMKLKYVDFCGNILYLHIVVCFLLLLLLGFCSDCYKIPNLHYTCLFQPFDNRQKETKYIFIKDRQTSSWINWARVIFINPWLIPNTINLSKQTALIRENSAGRRDGWNIKETTWCVLQNEPEAVLTFVQKKKNVLNDLLWKKLCNQYVVVIVNNNNNNLF